MGAYKRNRHTATIEGPVNGFSTRGSLRTTLYVVMIDGKRAFHAASRDVCKDWLIRQGFRPG